MSFLFLISLLLTTINPLFLELKQNRLRCFVDFNNYTGIGIVNYQILSLEQTKEIKGVQLKIYDDSDQKFVTRHIIHSSQGKYTFNVEQPTGYRICAININYKDPVAISLQFESDEMENIKTDNAVVKEDINMISDKINTGIRQSQMIIDSQNLERSSEDEVFLKQKQYSRIFIYLTFTQILLLVLFSAYHIISLKRYLISKRMLHQQ